uniref:DUF2156 domain-containing protein n=1 Tax=Strongyloides papillosus TaxID=174720 RepID=A0A0N5BGP8_STREA
MFFIPPVKLMYGGELFVIEKDILRADADSVLNNLERYAYRYPTYADYCLNCDPKLYRYILAYLNCKKYGIITARVLPSKIVRRVFSS